MSSSNLLEVLHSIISSRRHSVSDATRQLLEDICRQLLDPGTLTKLVNLLKTHVTDLVMLQSLLPDSGPAERLLGTYLKLSLPRCHDGSPSFEKPPELARLTLNDKIVFNGVSINKSLDRARWTESTTDIITSLLYTRVDARQQFLHWLTTTKLDDSSIHRIPALHAYLDASSHEMATLTETEHAILALQYKGILKAYKFTALPRALLTMALECVTLLSSAIPQAFTFTHSSRITKKIQKMSTIGIPISLLRIGFRIAESTGGSLELRECLSEKTLVWSAQHFSSNDENNEEALELFSCLRS